MSQYIAIHGVKTITLTEVNSECIGAWRELKIVDKNGNEVTVSLFGDKTEDIQFTLKDHISKEV